MGEDQQQHIELTREIVRRCHALFGEVTLDAVLGSGAERARLLAEQTLDQVRKLMGLHGSWSNASS